MDRQDELARCDRAVVDHLDEQSHRLSAGFEKRNVDRRQRGNGEGCHLDVIAADDGAVLRHSLSVVVERFEDADQKKPDAPQIEPDPDAPPKPEFVIVDHEISPSQARNLERATGAQVLDRTGVIMEIFHRHAHSREAKLQVEIARLKYAPRYL